MKQSATGFKELINKWLQTQNMTQNLYYYRIIEVRANIIICYLNFNKFVLVLF